MEWLVRIVRARQEAARPLHAAGRPATGEVRRPSPPNAGSYYRSVLAAPLTVAQVRDRDFPVVRRGVDPAAVRSFLERVAGELAAARAETIRTREENARLRRALRDWQARPGPRR